MRVHNFSAGPAMLPESLMRAVQEELLDWQGLGLSAMEIGHRQPKFQELMTKARSGLRELLNIPSNYHVLFLGGPSRAQFSMVPLNLLQDDDKGAYLVSGLWSSLSFKEANRLKNVYKLASNEESEFRALPHFDISNLQNNTSYLYYTPNETVNGLQIKEPPRGTDLPIIADMTSCLLGEPINISDYGLIFAGTQKNIAPAGLTIVIIRDDLVQDVDKLPVISTYKTFADTDSNYATPPTFNIYMADKMFDWIKAQGGVGELYKANCLKAKTLYEYIDSSDFYYCDVEKDARSIINACFHLRDESLDSKFVEQSTSCGLFGLKGHRLVKGMRASMYNSMTLSSVHALIDFMHDFAKDNG